MSLRQEYGIADVPTEQPIEQPIEQDCESRVHDAMEGKLFYDFNRSGAYWMPNQHHGWILVNEGQLKRALKAAGISPKMFKGQHISALDERLLDIQGNWDVHYSGPLAGRDAGLHQVGGKRVLVTESPKLIRPVPGDWSVLEKFLRGLLVDGECDQLPYFYGWCKVVLVALLSGQRRPGQVFVLCGPAGCGKSLLQNLFTLLLGGRSAKPYQYMTGKTPFNGELFEAEHLMIEDEQSSTDIRARREFGTKIKELTVNDTQRCHPKGRPALTLDPFWRVSITINDEPENLLVLPPFDESLEDKLILLKAFKKSMPMPTDRNEERLMFWKALTDGLPGFIDFLKSWEIPDALRSERFGIQHFHHPDLIKALQTLAPEQKLLRILDCALFEVIPLVVPRDIWTGSAERLEQALTQQDAAFAYETRKLLTWPNAMGTYLGRLAKQAPERVSYERTSRERLWKIKCPPKGDQ